MQPYVQSEAVTPREIEIVKMLAEGLNSKEISCQLSISEHTVHTHRRNIVKKLRVRNVAHLVSYAWQNGMCSSLNRNNLSVALN